MLVFISSVLLLFVHNTYSGLIAKAMVHSDSSNDRVGYLSFMQNDANSPVIINGKLWKLEPTTVHVSFQTDVQLWIFSFGLH
jgi:hypothetical protein